MIVMVMMMGMMMIPLLLRFHIYCWSSPIFGEMFAYVTVSKSYHRGSLDPSRSRTICVKPDKYWHCFEGNLGETAERRGEARIGLSERYDAILS